MKTLAALILVTFTPGTSNPEYGCDLEKGYCVVKIEAMRELMQSQKRRCTELDA